MTPRSSFIVAACLASACVESGTRVVGPGAKPPNGPVKRIVLGSTFTIPARWGDSCVRRTREWVSDTSQGPPNPFGKIETHETYYTCNEQRYAVRVACSARCELADRDTSYKGNTDVAVRALELGRLSVELEMTHATTSERRTRQAAVEVILPDEFRLQCFTPAKKWGPCADGISAEEPLFRVFVFGDASIHKTPLLRVNGRTAPKGSDFTIGAPLAAFLPDPVSGSVAPGAYTLVVSVGEKEATFTLDAR